MSLAHPASDRIRDLMRNERTFQISVDTGTMELGLTVASAAVAAGVTLLEIGTPLCKCEGVLNVVPAFRTAFPDALLLADMKTMDGGAFEARAVYQGGGNIIDFLAIAGEATARNACAVRDEFRAENPDIPRLAFADVLVPHQGPASTAIDVARRMLDAGVDGIGIHLQLDARRADPNLLESNYLPDLAEAMFEAVGQQASVQVVGGLNIERARRLAKKGLRAFVISGNLGLPDAATRYNLPPDQITALIADFIREVRAA